MLISAPSQEHFQPLPSLQLLLDDALPPPSRPRGAQHAVRSGCCVSQLTVLRPRTSARCVCGWRIGKGEGGARRGDKIIAFSGSILGDARRQLFAPCRAQQAVRSGRCAEKLRVCYLACLIVWLLALCG